MTVGEFFLKNFEKIGVWRSILPFGGVNVLLMTVYFDGLICKICIF